MKTALVLAAAIAYALWKLIARYSPAPEFDAKNVYLPFARKLLDAPAAFLASEQSLWVAPFSYFYPALFGADAARIKIANIALFVLLIVIVFRVGVLLHSRFAGLVAAVLLAASPTIKIYIPTALTEPPYLFLLGVWIWALCEGHRSGRTQWWIVSGLALGLAILTRPTYLYFAPLALAAGAFVWWRRRSTEPNRDARGIAIAHAVALGIAALVIARNAVLFDYPSTSTGSGAAIFLGSNPMTNGYDAGYLGLLLDDGAVHGGKGHLTIEGDRLLRRVAATALADMSLATLATMYANKLGAFLFVTQAEWEGVPEILRAWRIALLVFAAYGWWHIRVPAVKWLLGFAIAYQVAVHIPALYTFRYSVSALDLPLTIAAGIGIAQAWARARTLAIVGALAALGITAGQAAARFSEPASPHVGRIPHTVFWKADFQPPVEAAPGKPLDVEVRDAPGLHPWDNSILEVTLSAKGGTCRGYALRYRRADSPDFRGPLYRRASIHGTPEEHAAGTRVPLELYAGGTLQIEGDCESAATLVVHKARITSGRFATFYREKLLGEPPIPGTVEPRAR